MRLTTRTRLLSTCVVAAVLAALAASDRAHAEGGRTMVGAGATSAAPLSQIVVDAYAGTERGTGGTVYLHSSGPSSPGFIALDCVVITDIGVTAHGLQASGEGDDGRRYYLGVRDFGASSLGDFAIITTQPAVGECQAFVPDNPMFLPAAFVTTES